MVPAADAGSLAALKPSQWKLSSAAVELISLVASVAALGVALARCCGRDVGAAWTGACRDGRDAGCLESFRLPLRAGLGPFRLPLRVGIISTPPSCELLLVPCGSLLELLNLPQGQQPAQHTFSTSCSPPGSVPVPTTRFAFFNVRLETLLMM